MVVYGFTLVIYPEPFDIGKSVDTRTRVFASKEAWDKALEELTDPDAEVNTFELTLE